MLAAVLLQPLLSCNTTEEAPSPADKVSATVRNLTGLDGCGFVLELDSKKRLEPHGTLWQNFAKHDGARVTITYVSEPAPSVCMVGEGVVLTFIE